MMIQPWEIDGLRKVMTRSRMLGGIVTGTFYQSGVVTHYAATAFQTPYYRMDRISTVAVVVRIHHRTKNHNMIILA